MSDDNFDFKQLSEEEEKLDFNKLISCPNCKKPIPQDATICLYCGGEVVDKSKASWIMWVAIAMIIIFIIFIIL